MARNHVLELAAMKNALTQLAATEPPHIRLGKLDEFVGDQIRMLHRKGFEPNDIATALHQVSSTVPLAALAKHIHEICVAGSPDELQAAPQSLTIGQASGDPGPRPRGRPRKTPGQSVPAADNSKPFQLVEVHREKRTSEPNSLSNDGSPSAQETGPEGSLGGSEKGDEPRPSIDLFGEQ